jgi:3-methyl-2-oxobutanoate hydroxymethyltransferase
MNILDFKKMKIEKRPISMVTCYDYTSAKQVNDSEIDVVLVGDSLAMVMHGFPSTIHATIEMMALHTAAVSRGLTGPSGSNEKFLVADMPFLSVRKGIGPAMDCVDALMKAGAHSVKIEGVDGHEDVIQQIVGSGVPVMGHLGLTPQSIHQFGGFKVQGRDEMAEDVFRQAKRTQELGCFALVLECIPAPLAERISRELSIPTIGIGAGVGVDGQVLVFQDLLGMNPDFKPKFVRNFMNGKTELVTALNQFHREVVGRSFPGAKETYLT